HFLLYRSFRCLNPINAAQMPACHGLLASFSRLTFERRWHPMFQMGLAASRSPISSRYQLRQCHPRFRRSTQPSSEVLAKECSKAIHLYGLLHRQASSFSKIDLFAASPFLVKAFSIFQL